MRPGGKPFSDDPHDPGIDTGERLWKLNEINITEPAPMGNRLVMPADPEKV